MECSGLFGVAQVLSDEVKRKQYDTYGSAGFDPGQAGAGQQQYWRGGATLDPEELFRKIFGEFSGGRGFSDFGDFNSIFHQQQEVGNLSCSLLREFDNRRCASGTGSARWRLTFSVISVFRRHLRSVQSVSQSVLRRYMCMLDVSLVCYLLPAVHDGADVHTGG